MFDVETEQKKRKAKLVKGAAVEGLLMACSLLGKKLNTKLELLRKAQLTLDEGGKVVQGLTIWLHVVTEVRSVLSHKKQALEKTFEQCRYQVQTAEEEIHCWQEQVAASLRSLDSCKSDRGWLLERTKELEKIEAVLEEDKESVPIPIGTVERTEREK